MTGGRDLLRRSRGVTADTARLRQAAVRRKGYSQTSPSVAMLARPFYSPDQRARRRVPASGSPGSAVRHPRLCFSAGRRRAADPGLTEDNL